MVLCVEYVAESENEKETLTLDQTDSRTTFVLCQRRFSHNLYVHQPSLYQQRRNVPLFALRRTLGRVIHAVLSRGLREGFFWG